MKLTDEDGLHCFHDYPVCFKWKNIRVNALRGTVCRSVVLLSGSFQRVTKSEKIRVLFVRNPYEDFLGIPLHEIV